MKITTTSKKYRRVLEEVYKHLAFYYASPYAEGASFDGQIFAAMRKIEAVAGAGNSKKKRMLRLSWHPRSIK